MISCEILVKTNVKQVELSDWDSKYNKYGLKAYNCV